MTNGADPDQLASEALAKTGLDVISKRRVKSSPLSEKRQIFPCHKSLPFDMHPFLSALTVPQINTEETA